MIVSINPRSAAFFIPSEHFWKNKDSNQVSPLKYHKAANLASLSSQFATFGGKYLNKWISIFLNLY